jgi:hypothetical protein
LEYFRDHGNSRLEFSWKFLDIVHVYCKICPWKAWKKLLNIFAYLIFTTVSELRIFAGWKTWKCWV